MALVEAIAVVVGSSEAMVAMAAMAAASLAAPGARRRRPAAAPVSGRRRGAAGKKRGRRAGVVVVARSARVAAVLDGVARERGREARARAWPGGRGKRERAVRRRACVVVAPGVEYAALRFSRL
jgi:hypothetical protein